MGRRKIEIKMLEDKSARQITFSKRRQGLFTKANELVTMCGGEVAIFVFSPGGKPFSFGSPSVVSVTDKFLNEESDEISSGSCSNGSSSRNHHKISMLGDQYKDLTEQLQIEEKKSKMLEEALSQNNLKKCKLPIDELDLSELQKLKGSLENLRDVVKFQVSEMEACSSLLLLTEKPVKERESRLMFRSM